ncbi:MAG: hypothetical protein GYA57_13615, partial [Myxococcales bacterium]|nr:hypothetical protein [Myxococcales bacterium]
MRRLHLLVCLALPAAGATACGDDAQPAADGGDEGTGDEGRTDADAHAEAEARDDADADAGAECE